MCISLHITMCTSCGKLFFYPSKTCNNSSKTCNSSSKTCNSSSKTCNNSSKTCNSSSKTCNSFVITQYVRIEK